MHIAVIVPTLNEEHTLGALLTSLEPQLEGEDEVIVVDGGSTDRTLEKSATATVIRTESGRGRQLDAGARHAISRGAQLLVFVHADSNLPADLLSRLRALDPSTGGGCLVKFVGANPLLRFGERLVNWRTRTFKRPLGDQVQFATREAYLAAGGFPNWPILEDTAFIDRLRREGSLDILEVVIGTSARRFHQSGTIKTVLTNWLIWILYRLGMSPKRLASLYRQSR